MYRMGNVSYLNIWQPKSEIRISPTAAILLKDMGEDYTGFNMADKCAELKINIGPADFLEFRN